METRAVAKHQRISPRKARQVIDLVRGKDVDEAIGILKNTPRKASDMIEDVINSAAANAEHNHEMIRDELYISEAFVDQGPTMKRYKPRAMGQASTIRKRTSHITIVVSDEKEEG
ncbi:50S ribosomal protein L22 [Halarsenatibacter silvermanii]|uniref:Large ribosomal subunit protein uL22 n=1 Tax=Halarsenatibacter silvermanii TaxID=321763 RepID=A0A1G9NBI7_9FIRM|nr:50S ribosomal protein L22 [Halarsenatibacter silvermanii]SDL83255.1 LSU ribosomal protein L22P [Halarsenatibacter silvermanii]